MYTVYNDTRLHNFCHRCSSSRDRGHKNCICVAGRAAAGQGLLWTAKAAVQWHGPPAAASTHCKKSKGGLLRKTRARLDCRGREAAKVQVDPFFLSGPACNRLNECPKNCLQSDPAAPPRPASVPAHCGVQRTWRLWPCASAQQISWALKGCPCLLSRQRPCQPQHPWSRPCQPQHPWSMYMAVSM